MHLVPRRSRPTLLFVTIAMLAEGCATQSSTTGTYVPLDPGDAARNPRRVLVTDFAVDAGRVGLDQGIGPRLERQLSPGAPSASRTDTAAQVQAAIAETLVGRNPQNGPARATRGIWNDAAAG